MTASHYIRIVLGDEPFGIDASAIEEVTQRFALTRLPAGDDEAPTALVGLADLRGVLRPVLCLRRLLGMAGRRPSLEDRFVFLSSGTAKAGFVVDRVEDVVEIAAADRHPVDRSASAAAYRYVTEVDGRGDGAVPILDPMALLSARELEWMAERPEEGP